MKRYRVEVIGQVGSSRTTPHQYAGGISHDLNDIQEKLGDGWELVSCTDGPRPFTIVTIWRTVETEKKQTGNQWMVEFDHHILDLDGWRHDDGVDFLITPITLDEYRRRYNECTVNGARGKQDF